MNAENSTGNPARLPLAERAARGLLLSKPDWLPTQAELPIEDVLWLEHPVNLEDRAALADMLEVAILCGDLLARLDEDDLPATEFVQRNAYRAWRLTCPQSLLSEPGLSQIHKWLGATPTAETIPPAIPSLPESESVAVAHGGAAENRRDDVLTHAIRAAIAVLSPSGGALPRPPKLLEYLLQNSGKGNKFPDFTVKGKALLWTADNGREKNTDVAAITERLRRWKG